MNAFTIKDIENLSGVKAHTIRVWEQRYKFLKPQRTDTNIRYYSNEELKSILNIALLNKAGFKISHIDKMDPDEISRKIVSLSLPEVVHERFINELVGYMIDFDSEAFEMALDSHLKIKDIDFFINCIIFPFLEKVGILWTTNHVNPAQEHLVTNIIRQKILVGIENCEVNVATDKSILLFLPEGEHHEIGLLYVYYMMKSAGLRVLYLGADVPIKDLEFTVKVKKPDFVYTHLTSLAANFNMDKFIQNISVNISGVPFYISGLVAAQYKKSLPAHIYLKRSLEEVKDLINELTGVKENHIAENMVNTVAV